MSIAETSFQGTGKPTTIDKPLEEIKRKELESDGKSAYNNTLHPYPLKSLKEISKYSDKSEIFLATLASIIGICYFIYIILSTTHVLGQTTIWPGIPYKRPCPINTTDTLSNFKKAQQTL